MTRKRGFTLIELLVVIAIIAILAAILFPVFAGVRERAKQTSCISNFRNEAMAVMAYTTAYDDYYPLTQYMASPQYEPPDSVAQLLIQPYMKSLQVLICPSDPTSLEQRNLDPNDDKTPGNTQAKHDLYIASRSDFGINCQYFGPLGGGPDGGIAINQSLVGAPASSIYAVESVWGRDGSGNTYGGGNYAIDPPCVTYAASQGGGSSLPPHTGHTGYYWFGGWTPSQPNAWNVFGGAWPWHGGLSGRTCDVMLADGHAKALRIEQLAAGCDVKDGWGGTIFDKNAYLWDLQ